MSRHKGSQAVAERRRAVAARSVPSVSNREPVACNVNRGALGLYFTNRGQYNTGVTYGFSTHERKMVEALKAAGVEIADGPGDRYDLAISFSAPYHFEKAMVKGRKNILFTTSESPTLAPLFRPPVLGRATAIVVPTQFSADSFGKYSNVPIEVCTEGIDPANFPFFGRKAPSDRDEFKFLWVGASSPRKGLVYIWDAWSKWHVSGRAPENATLTFKTTADPGYRGETGISRAARTKVTLDSRDVPPKKLLDMYQAAHCFLYPSEAEGWGLGLGEAMATGLPCIWTHHSAMKDWCDPEAGYPLTRFRVIPEERFPYAGISLNMTEFARRDFPEPKPMSEVRGKVKGMAFALPDVHELVEKMDYVYHNYAEALERGRRASERMHGRYTWAQAAARFVEICRKYA